MEEGGTKTWMRRKELERRFDNIEETLSKVGEIIGGINKDSETWRAGIFKNKNFSYLRKCYEIIITFSKVGEILTLSLSLQAKM